MEKNLHCSAASWRNSTSKEKDGHDVKSPRASSLLEEGLNGLSQMAPLRAPACMASCRRFWMQESSQTNIIVSRAGVGLTVKFKSRRHDIWSVPRVAKGEALGARAYNQFTHFLSVPSYGAYALPQALRHTR